MDLEETYYQKQPVEMPLLHPVKLSGKPLGEIFGARSGDKGGCANIGVWAKSENAFSFLNNYLTVEKIKELMPDLSKFEIDRYELPNILSLNFYIHGILEDGVSSNTRKDGQAKSLGEYLRAKYADIPKSLFEEKHMSIDKLSLEGLDFQATKINIKNNILTITLNRPEKKNALNNVMMNELNYALAYAKQEREIRVVVIDAEGDIFCAGADLRS